MLPLLVWGACPNRQEVASLQVCQPANIHPDWTKEVLEVLGLGSHIGKSAPTCSSSSWSTFAKVLGKLVVSSLVGFVTALASHHQSVMNAMFAHEFTDTNFERQQKSQYGGHEHEQLLKLHSECSGTAAHGAVDTETAPFSASPSLAHFTCLEHEWEGA